MSTDDAPVEVTEELFDSIAAPLFAAAALSMLDAQLDTLTDVETELRDTFANWEPEMRGRASKDLRTSIQNIREHLDRIESALP